ncbi:MAG: cupredoxin domain-containing protein [Candidatus Levybacteria bacterium]|nr:cupredoxin domain-containing protein [Candidatus Levybacteria bacterium]
MEPDKLLVTIVGIFGIGFVYWFFLHKKDEEAVTVNSGQVDIAVKGGYSPGVISIPKDKQTILNFIRRDESSCLEEVVIPEFKIRKYLPLNKSTSIVVKPKKSGTFEISCGMNMFHGKIMVR